MFHNLQSVPSLQLWCTGKITISTLNSKWVLYCLGCSMLGWYPWPVLHWTVGLLYENWLEGRHTRNWHCCCQWATQLLMPQYQTSNGSHLKTSWWRYEFRLPQTDDSFNILTSLEPNIMINIMSLGRIKTSHFSSLSHKLLQTLLMPVASLNTGLPLVWSHLLLNLWFVISVLALCKREC